MGLATRSPKLKKKLKELNASYQPSALTAATVRFQITVRPATLDCLKAFGQIGNTAPTTTHTGKGGRATAPQARRKQAKVTTAQQRGTASATIATAVNLLAAVYGLIGVRTLADELLELEARVGWLNVEGGVLGTLEGNLEKLLSEVRIARVVRDGTGKTLLDITKKGDE